MINNKGQSIIEVLVAFVILTFVLTGIVIAGLYSVRNTQFARNKSIATKLASEQLERVRVKRDSQGISSMTGCGPCYVDSDVNLTYRAAPRLSGIFSVSTSIVVVSASGAECPLPGGVGIVYKATSNISWGTVPHRVTLASCFSDWR